MAKKGRKRSYFKRVFGGKMKIIQPNAIIYGGLRNPIAAKMPQISMAGNYSDELTCGVISWLAAKYGGGFIKEVGMAGLTVENANVGAGLGSQLGGTGGTATGSAYLLG